MTRDFRYRAWDKVYKKMYLPDDQPGPVFYLNGSLSLDQTWVTGDFILMQYTGFKDVLGKEIYEGDILRNAFGSTMRVGYCYTRMGWVAISEIKVMDLDVKSVSVIGNIFENPDLFN